MFLASAAPGMFQTQKFWVVKAVISMQKIRDTTILQFLGAPTALLNKILFFMGLKKGLKGAVWGLFSGNFVVLFQSTTKLIPIPSNVYFTDSLPMSIYLFEACFMCFYDCVCALGVCAHIWLCM